MTKPVSLVQYWAGCPSAPNSKWLLFVRTIRRCAEEGWTTHLVWSRMPENLALAQPFLDCGCKILIQPRAKGNFDLGCVFRTRRMLLETQCDVLHCYTVHTSPLIAGWLAGVPVRVWSKLGMSPYYERGVKPVGLHRLMISTRISGLLSHRVLAVAAAVKEELICQGIAPSRVSVLYPPVDTRSLSAATLDGIRAEMGLPKDALVVTSVGHAVPVKGWDVLIRAFADALQNMPQARLLLVGSTDAPNEVATARELRAMADDLGVADKVRFVGHRTDVPRLLRASDVFVLPSRSEGFPAALAEALFSGLPCIAARVGGIPELITHGVNGLLFAREDHGELASHLVCLASSADMQKRFAAIGKREAQRLDTDSHVDALYKTYVSLLRATA